MGHEEKLLPVRAVTRGPRHHFFGYYEKSPWDATGRYLLALETDFNDRPPRADDVAGIGLIDTANGDAWKRLDETTAWNWQQGTMLQWVPGAADREIIYNVRAGRSTGSRPARPEPVEGRAGDCFGAVIRDVFTGECRALPRPVYAMNPAGGSALSDNFARLAHSRPGYGYAPGESTSEALSLDFARLRKARPVVGYVGTSENLIENPAPEDDGVYSMDLKTGECRLVITLAQAAALRPKPSMEDAFHWINHIQYNTSGTRFAFLHRWKGPETGRSWFTRLVTANLDGTGLRILADEGMVSHYDWLGTDRVLAWARREPVGTRYFLFSDDDSGEAEAVGEGILTCDGHCSYSLDRRWILTDAYPDVEHMRTLVLYRPEDAERVDVGRFYAPPELAGEIRCDLHPRWSRNGKKVCFDSAHEGTRQMYVMDVSQVVRQATSG